MPAHAYSIMRAEQVSGHSLVKVRNTWGSSEWKLKWSDSDTRSWTPALKAELGFASADDGMFWMSAEDFRQRFRQVTFCQFLEANFPPSLPSHDSTPQDTSASASVSTVTAPVQSAHVQQTHTSTGASAAKSVVPVLQGASRKYRIRCAGQWNSSSCGGIGDWRNPQLLFELLPFSEQVVAPDEIRIWVELQLPGLMQNRGFEAIIGLELWSCAQPSMRVVEPWVAASKEHGADEDCNHLFLHSVQALVKHGSRGVQIDLEDCGGMDPTSSLIIIPQVTSRTQSYSVIVTRYLSVNDCADRPCSWRPRTHRRKIPFNGCL